jgi:hypothetical protein
MINTQVCELVTHLSRLCALRSPIGRVCGRLARDGSFDLGKGIQIPIGMELPADGSG